jgi:hypothetical protein
MLKSPILDTRILLKAEDRLSQRRELERYIRVCVEAGLCPYCGADLTPAHGDVGACQKES